MPVRGNQYKCYYCGTEEKCTKDHFYPKSKGGKYLVWACHSCQRHKSNLLPLDWLEKIDRTRMPQDAKDRIRTAVTTLIEILDTSGLSPNLAYVYALNSRVKVLTRQQVIEQKNDLLISGWKHTATIDPFQYIQKLVNRECTAVQELRKLYRSETK
jgi:hypothetical protein